MLPFFHFYHKSVAFENNPGHESIKHDEWCLYISFTVGLYSYYNESSSNDVHKSPQSRSERTRKVQGQKLVVEAKNQ